MEKETIERILINKSNELRVARIKGQKLYDLEIEQIDSEQAKVDNICNAEIVSIEPSLEAAFVNFGSKRNGFLPLKEIAPKYYPQHLQDKQGRVSIKDILFEGQKILIQITKEERGTKGAALSTYITLAGRYLVLMPNNPKAGGVSRRVEGEDRENLKEKLASLKLPSGMGIIIRTAGVGKSLEELQWDLDALLNLWKSIQEASKSYGAPYLIHQESDIAICVIRDHLRSDIDEILIDDQEIYNKIRTYIEKIQPAFLQRIKLYTQPVPLFSRFQIEQQIESVFQRKVRLPSGGEIIIDRTEALTSIDVNSAQATKGEYIEETALNTNLEAAQELARQLRIRDLGGLFVIDFIDMEEEENNRKVEDCLRNALRSDRARTQLWRISRFGLLEMSRQRLRSALNETSQVICPRCHGQGTIRNIPSLATSIIHLIQENALKEKITQIQVQVPIDVASYLLNEKRESISNIEKLHSKNIIVLLNPDMKIPQYKIECIQSTTRGERPFGTKASPLSYELLTVPALTHKTESIKPTTQKQEPVIKGTIPLTPAPIAKVKKWTLAKWLKNVWKFLANEGKRVEKDFDKTTKERKPYSKHFVTKPRTRYNHYSKSTRPQNSRTRKPGAFTPRPSKVKTPPPMRGKTPVVQATPPKQPLPDKKPETIATQAPVKVPVATPAPKPVSAPIQKNIIRPQSEKKSPEQLIMVETKKE